MTKQKFYLFVPLFVVSLFCLHSLGTYLYLQFIYSPATQSEPNRIITVFEYFNPNDDNDEGPAIKEDKEKTKKQYLIPVNLIQKLTDEKTENGGQGKPEEPPFPWLLLISCTTLLLIVWYFWRNRRQKTYILLDDDEPFEKTRLQKKQTMKASPVPATPSTRVRRAVQQLHFELPRHLKKHPEETVEEWFARINFLSTSPIYHAHRYGDLEESAFSEREIDDFESDVAHFLKQHTKGGFFS